MTNQQIIKEFDKKFPPEGITFNIHKQKDVRDFWLSKLEAQNQDLLKKIEEKGRDILNEAFVNYADTQDIGKRDDILDQALEDIKKLI